MKKSGSGSVAVVLLDGRSLTLESFRSVVFEGAAATVAEDARSRVRAARRVIDRAVAAGEPVYGVNTGFGNLANVRIPDRDLAALQERLVL